MPKQDNWKEKFDRKVNKLISSMPKGDGWCTETFEFGYKHQIGNEIHTVTDWGNVSIFISSLLSSQAHALKERMKACIPEENTYKRDTHDELFAEGYNCCRNELLSAIESIEI